MKTRKWLASLLAIAMMLALVACGGGTQSGGSAQSSGGSGSGDAEKVYTFKVQNHDPSSSICAQFIDDWCAEVTEASGGRIQFQTFHGGALGGAGETVDMVLNGNADIGWTSSSINTGRMPYTDVITMPMSGLTDTIQAAKVMWYLYENYTEISDEWSDFYVIECSAACGVPWTTTNKQITSAKDFEGLRMRCVTPPVVYMAQALGCVPMSITIPDTYENLEKNVADGCLNDWHNIKAFSLWDVLDYAMDVQINYSNQALIMNKDSYNSLPDDLKAVIDEHSGEYAALMAGEYWESSVEQSKELGREAGVTIYEPNAEVQAALEAAAEIGIQTWVDDMNSKGYDGDGIIAAYKEALELFSE